MLSPWRLGLQCVILGRVTYIQATQEFKMSGSCLKLGSFRSRSLNKDLSTSGLFGILRWGSETGACSHWGGKTCTECQQHHPISWVPRWSQKQEETHLCTPLQPSWAGAFLLLLLSPDIILQLLQPFNMDSHKRRSKELPSLRPQTRITSLVLHVLRLPVSRTEEQLLGSLALQLADGLCEKI
jgi:hypothetical protein